ncbi:MAG: GntR family transcriptional regulator [Bacteroidales bacterium]|nr:GntR family transcriptional regulator [Bacteroidales bacterium]
MISIGNKNTLRVVKEVDFGMYLDGGEIYGEIHLPLRYVPADCKPEDEIEVFIYFDSEDRIIATTETPYAEVNEFALLKCVASTRVGAFLDWGLSKDLLVPFREQKVNMVEGNPYLVHIYLDDESTRIVASAKLDKFLDLFRHQFTENQEVDLIIADKTDLGYNAIIDESHMGILYHNEVFQSIKKGDQLKGFIKKIREDGKIDLCLQKGGFEKIDSFAQALIDDLVDSNGFLDVTDKSSAEEISKRYGVSKKTFKKAIGTLYKKKLITIENDGIRLVPTK